MVKNIEREWVPCHWKCKQRFEDNVAGMGRSQAASGTVARGSGAGW